ncbi:HNH endonuclease [Afipia sp. TerB]
MRKAKGKRIYLHHVVLPGKRYPEYVRDHINRDKLDNRAANLRWVTFSQSAQNRNPYRRKHCLGLRGVMPVAGGYRATVTVNRIIHRLGIFTSATEAAEAACEARRELMPFSEDAAA